MPLLIWSRNSVSRSHVGRQRFDHHGNLAQVVVELMIAAGHLAEMGLWNRVRKQLSVPRWRGVIREAMVKIDRDLPWKFRTQLTLGFPTIKAPTARSGEFSASAWIRIVPPSE